MHSAAADVWQDAEDEATQSGTTLAGRTTSTPVGSKSGWRIDDVYVDPFKQR